MLAKMLQDFVSDLEAELEQWADELRPTLDFAELEEAVRERVHCLCAGLLEHLLNERLGEPEWWHELKRLGGRLGMRFKEYRWVTVRLGHGQQIQVRSAYFVKARSEEARAKWARIAFRSRVVGLYWAL